MAEFTHPQSMCSIRAGTTVVLAPLGTDESALFIEWTCKDDDNVATLSIAFCMVLSKHFKLPTQCFRLVWDSEVRADTITANYILQELTDEMHESMPDHDNCFVCSGPCRDADEDGTRELNCYRCEPCFLCSACKVLLPDGLSCCFVCLLEDEIPLVSDQRRLQLLVPEIFH
jgi:hypothetical protein